MTHNLVEPDFESCVPTLPCYQCRSEMPAFINRPLNPKPRRFLQMQLSSNEIEWEDLVVINFVQMQQQPSTQIQEAHRHYIRMPDFESESENYWIFESLLWFPSRSLGKIMSASTPQIPTNIQDSKYQMILIWGRWVFKWLLFYQTCSTSMITYVFTIEPRLVNKVQALNTISLKHLFCCCPFLDLHPTAQTSSNIASDWDK